jgi:putative transposase
MAAKYRLAITVSTTGRGGDAVTCLRKAIAEAARLLKLDDRRDDRGVMDLVDADGQIIGQAPAPIAIVPDNGSCFRGQVFTQELADQNRTDDGQDPLLRHVRTRVKSPQTTALSSD